MDLLENGSLKILLSEDDMRTLELTFEDLDYNNENTRSALHHLLEVAREETGFDTSGSLLIEALPVDGGCLLLLTPTGSKRHVRMKRVMGPYVFEMDDVDAVLGFASSMAGRTPSMFGSSLYRFGERYRLILYPGTPLSKDINHLLMEFARPAGEGDAAAAFTAEHGHSIVVGDALHMLCTAVTSRSTQEDIPLA